MQNEQIATLECKALCTGMQLLSTGTHGNLHETNYGAFQTATLNYSLL